MTNKEIVDSNLELLHTCVDCQFAKLKDAGKLQYKEDFINDMVITLYEYDNEKMMDAYMNNHLNALITKMIVNNIYSSTSKFYKDYLKFSNKTEELLIDEEV